MSRWLIGLTGLLILAFVNVHIYQKEQLLTQGQVVLLELAPIDPRSLLQGDYMALRFQLQDAIPLEDPGRDGFAIVVLDEAGVARFRRLDQGAPLAAGERRLFYRTRHGQVQLGTNAFFFQEGTADFYNGARYGEARLDQNGDLLLTGLRDEARRRLGPP